MINRKGAILITSLWILAILSILAMGIGFRVSVEARLAKYNMDRMRALYLAKAGVVKSLYRLSKNPTAYDSMYECGTVFSPEEKSDPGKLNAVFNSALDSGSFSVAYKEEAAAHPGMSDEERRININTAPQNVLENLLMYVGEDPGIAASIVQWRSPGPGLDDGYYQALPAPYKCKHEKFSAIEELLLVKGVNQQVFARLKDYVTIFGDPARFAININTAPKAVLGALIMAYAPTDKIAADFCADKIIDFRSGPDKQQGTKDDTPFNSANINIEWISQGALSATQAANLKNYLIIKSNYFHIESTGIMNSSKVGKKIVCVAAKDTAGNFKFLYYREY